MSTALALFIRIVDVPSFFERAFNSSPAVKKGVIEPPIPTKPLIAPRASPDTWALQLKESQQSNEP